MTTPRIDIPHERLAALCRAYGVRRLALFGSVLREDFGPESDLDILVEFEPGTRTGFRYFELADELSALLERKVDLNTPATLNKYHREHVLEQAVVEFDAA